MPKSSKKSKWKKIQIEKLEEHLEEVNKEQAMGEVADESLYKIDTDGSASLSKSVEKIKRKIEQPLAERRKVAKLSKHYEKQSVHEVKESNKEKKEEVKKTSKIDVKDNLRDVWSDGTKLSRSAKSVKHKLETPYKIKSVPIPIAGSSYNPSVEDHYEAVEKAKEKEEKYEEIKKKESTLPPPPDESMFLEGGPEDDNEEGIMIQNPKTKEKRKTRSERNKSKITKQKQNLPKIQQKIKQFNQQLDSAKVIARQIEKEKKDKEMKKEEIEKKKQEKYENELPIMKKKGKKQITVPNLEIPLSDEIAGNMRSMTNIKDALKDRVKIMKIKKQVF